MTERRKCRKTTPIIYFFLELALILEINLIINFVPIQHKIVLIALGIFSAAFVLNSIYKTIMIYDRRCKHGYLQYKTYRAKNNQQNKRRSK